MSLPTLGLDIGGANLKVAHTTGLAREVPFALWKAPTLLRSALQVLMDGMPAHDRLAITMTGELCDCFETRREGVQFILDVVGSLAGEKPVRVWQITGRFASLGEARQNPLQSAAANWLALATFAGRHAAAGPALLIDIGSTTTDLVPLLDGKPVPRVRTDLERLASHELVYTGVRRTPLCALLGLDHAAEFFATTLDVYLLLGAIPEDPSDRETADGRPATCAAAQARIARMACADAETLSRREVMTLAALARDRQVGRLQQAVNDVTAMLPGPPAFAILSGAGEFLAREVLLAAGCTAEFVSLQERLGVKVSRAACAYAVAVLAAEESSDAP